MTTESKTLINGAGLKISVHDYGGKGSPILLLHGAGCSLAHWLLIAPLLAKQHRVVAMDFRGHGLSEAGPWSIEALMDDVEAVCHHYGFSNAALVGHSMGGVLAILYAAGHSDISAVVNLDGFGLTPSEHVGLDPADVVERQRRIRTEAENSPPVPVNIEAMISSYLEENTLNAAQAKEIAEREHRQHSTEYSDRKDWNQTLSGIYWFIYDYQGGRSLFNLLSKTFTRVLIIRAKRRPSLLDQDPWKQELYSALFAGIARELPRIHNSRKVQIEEVDATHGLLLEIPKELASRISDFLQERE